MEYFDSMHAELYRMYHCFDRAYEQIALLTAKFEELASRYRAANRPLRRQLAVGKHAMRSLIIVYDHYLRLKKGNFASQVQNVR